MQLFRILLKFFGTSVSLRLAAVVASSETDRLVREPSNHSLSDRGWTCGLLGCLRSIEPVSEGRRSNVNQASSMQALEMASYSTTPILKGA
jgi:hypothetical protein